MHTGSRYIRGYSKRVKRQKKSDIRAKKVTKGAKANTPRQQSNRWTVQLNSKSVSDWRRSSRRPRKGRMVRLYRYSSTSSTSTRRCSYIDTWYSNRQQSSYVHHELFQFRARSESRMLSVPSRDECTAVPRPKM